MPSLIGDIINLRITKAAINKISKSETVKIPTLNKYIEWGDFLSIANEVSCDTSGKSTNKKRKKNPMLRIDLRHKFS